MEIKHYEIKRHFNILDLILVICAILLVAFGIWQFWKNTQQDREKVNVKVSLLFENVDNETITLLQNGDSFALTEGRNVLGKAENLVIAPQKIEVLREKILENDTVASELILADSTLYSCVSFDVVCSANVLNDGIRINGIEIKTEQMVSVYAKTFSGNAKVTVIQEVK